MVSLINQYNEDELRDIISKSFSYKECMLNLGYKAISSDAYKILKRKIKQLNIDISHFTRTTPIERLRENVFIENATCDQSTLRRWYSKENVIYECSICGQKPFWNGKELTLILDHKNGFNHDNRLENLRWVCPNCNYQLDTTNGKNINHGKRKLNYCIDCGELIGLKSIRCIKCNNKHDTIYKNSNISREQLKELIRSKPFTYIGELFSVSDNAIRKWCKKYNLPTKVSEIRKYSDNEWILI